MRIIQTTQSSPRGNDHHQRANQGPNRLENLVPSRGCGDEKTVSFSESATAAGRDGDCIIPLARPPACQL